MKKLIFTVAVLATMLASCSNNEVYDVVNTRGNSPISFTNLNDKVSRVANDKGDNYKVYAKSSFTGESDWFINDVIQNADNKPASGKVYYWPSASGGSETVDFYAWAPSTVTAKNPTYSSSSPELSIEYNVPGNADEDFTIAAPKTGMSSGTVDFKFSHMLTKISVSAALTTELTTAGYSIEFTSATLTVNSNGGKVNPTITPVWTDPNSTSATYLNAKSYMVMPQASTGCTVQLKGVTIKKGEATVVNGKDMKIYSIEAGNVTDNAFAKGSHYNLKLTVNNESTDGDGDPVFGGEIKFSASLAADWNTPATDIPLTQE